MRATEDGRNWGGGNCVHESQRLFHRELIEVGEGEEIPVRICNFEQQRFGLEPLALAIRTGRVSAITGEQDPDVHLVSPGFQPAEIPFNAVPGARPFVLLIFAVIRLAIDDPLLRFGR